MLGFDALGRLALGQIAQDYKSANPMLVGIGTTASVGSLKPDTLSNAAEVIASGSAGATASAITINLSGVSASARVGQISSPDAHGAIGVSGTGSAGTITASPQALIVSGVSGATSAGVITIQTTSPSIMGVGAVGSAGVISTALQALHVVGVQGTGSAGKVTLLLSGGGGRKLKTGLEPIARRPPPAPVETKLPTFVVPNFAAKAKPAPIVLARTPFERAPGIAPLDLGDMREQIQAAQDEADMKAVLAFLDDLD